MTTAVADPEIPPKPDRPCGVCGADDWWLRTASGKPEWLCGKCHPNPDGKASKQADSEVVSEEVSNNIC